MSISLGNSLSKGGMTGPTIVSDGLVLKHNYDAGAVVPVSDGAVYFDGSDDYIAITTPSVFNGETLNSFNALVINSLAHTLPPGLLTLKTMALTDLSLVAD